MLAGEFPDPRGGGCSKLRDAEGRQGRPVVRAGGVGERESPPQPQSSSRIPGDLSGSARWEALRLRVVAKEVARGSPTVDA